MATDLEIFQLQTKMDAVRKLKTDAETAGADALRSFYDNHGCQRCFAEYDNSDPARMRVYDIIDKAYKDYTNPKTRRKDRYYCDKHKKSLNAAIAAKDSLANIAGHVCWGYTTHPSYQDPYPWYTGTYAAGLTEHPKPDLTALTMFDQTQGTKPSTGFEAYGCIMQKNLSAEDGNFEEAWLRSMKMKEEPYFLIGNNCMDATHYILDGFGVEHLPLPTFHDPYSYFQAIQAPIIKLHP